jgi:hypothetical protein
MRTLETLGLFITLCIWVGRKDDGLGKYYQYHYADSVLGVVSSDSVHVFIIQVPVNSSISMSIPSEFVNDPALRDTIKLDLDVLFGSYSPSPAPIKNWSVRHDTLSLWYAHVPPPPHPLPKTVSISGATHTATSPLPEYYSIQRVVIRKSPSKHVSFIPMLYTFGS